jgi:hypothetical protein
MLLGAVPDRPNLVARLFVDDDSFTIISTPDSVEINYRDTLTEPDIVVRIGYQGFLDASEGRIPFDEFATRHLEIIDGATHADSFLTLITAAMTRPG